MTSITWPIRPPASITAWPMLHAVDRRRHPASGAGGWDRGRCRGSAPAARPAAPRSALPSRPRRRAFSAAAACSRAMRAPTDQQRIAQALVVVAPAGCGSTASSRRPVADASRASRPATTTAAPRLRPARAPSRSQPPRWSSTISAIASARNDQQPQRAGDIAGAGCGRTGVGRHVGRIGWKFSGNDWSDELVPEGQRKRHRRRA